MDKTALIHVGLLQFYPQPSQEKQFTNPQSAYNNYAMDARGLMTARRIQYN